MNHDPSKVKFQKLIPVMMFFVDDPPLLIKILHVLVQLDNLLKEGFVGIYSQHLRKQLVEEFELLVMLVDLVDLFVLEDDSNHS